MKVLLVLSVIYINYVTSNEKYAVKSYPKKVKTFGAGKILINPPKYPNYLFKPQPKALGYIDQNSSNRYTVFQVISDSKTMEGIPDSPYFTVDHTFAQKPRVKKVLPDYVWASLRRDKRSVPDVKPKKKSKNVIESTLTSGTEKSTITKSPEEKTVKTKLKKPKEKQELAFRAQDKIDLVTVKQDKQVTNALSTVTNKRKTKRNSTNSDPKKKSKSQKKRKVKRTKLLSAKSKTRNATKSKNKLIRKLKLVNGTAVMRAKTGKKRKSKSQRSKSSKKSKKHRNRNSTNLETLKETRRLTGARQALIEDYPYTVSIQKDGVHWCSGALLNPRMVITTANCLWKADRLSRMKVRCGASYADKGGQVAEIQEVMKHPKWGLRSNPDNDIAIVLLDRTIKFSHSVHGVDLPNRVMVPAFDDAWITSYGSERRDGIYEENEPALQVFHAFVMPNDTCNNITTRFGVAVTENFICFTQTGKVSPCTRDTGAPAVSDGILWGLASWSIRKLCGTERFPSVFTYTASHSNMDFITEALRLLMSDKRMYQFLDRTFPPKIRRGTTRRTTTTEGR